MMAHVGAFDTSQVPAALRYPYFMGLNLAGGLLSVAVTAALGRWSWIAARPFARVSAVIVSVTIVTTPLVWITAAWLLDGATSPLRMVELARQVAPVVALFTPVTMFRLQPDEAPHSSTAAPDRRATVIPCPLRAALPPGMRTAPIHAVEAHDHYLRVIPGMDAR